MVSEREFKQKLKEEWLSKWIDDLNHENKPNEEFVDQSDLTEKEREEMYELLDTVRFVKRLRIAMVKVLLRRIKRKNNTLPEEPLEFFW